jgi:hypothetical protein
LALLLSGAFPESEALVYQLGNVLAKADYEAQEADASAPVTTSCTKRRYRPPLARTWGELGRRAPGAGCRKRKRGQEIGGGSSAQIREGGEPGPQCINTGGPRMPFLIRRTAVPDVAITGEQLSTAVWALLDFAAWNVKLPLCHPTVRTERHVVSPAEAFVAISDSRAQFSADRVVR